MKALPVVRYSGDDDTGAMQRQRDEIRAWLAANKATTPDGPNDGWVEDETVSGAVPLDRRQSLGQWLQPPLLHRWDVMVVTSQDRVTRDDMHWWAFIGQLVDWGKHLVVLDDPSLDLSTPNGRMIAGIKATQAANYRLDVQNKLLRARESHRQHARFPGGHWPFGYRAVPRESGEGWQLEIDPDSSQWVREAVDRVLAEPGETLSEIAVDWANRGIPTAREHQANRQGRTSRKYKWASATLRKILLSPAIQGYGVHRGEIVRENGIPLQFADPIVSPGEAQQLRNKLTHRGKRRTRINRSELLGVLYCPCGAVMYFSRRTKVGANENINYQYYRCSKTVSEGNKCPRGTVNWRVETIKEILESSFLAELGDEEILEKRITPGVNRDDEIATLREAVDNLAANLANLPPGSRAATSVMQTMAEYEEQLDTLEQEPRTPAKEEYVGTGRTFRQWWEETTDWHERGRFLHRVGVWLELGGNPRVPHIHLFWPDDLLGKAQNAGIQGR